MIFGKAKNPKIRKESLKTSCLKGTKILATSPLMRKKFVSNLSNVFVESEKNL